MSNANFLQDTKQKRQENLRFWKSNPKSQWKALNKMGKGKDKKELQIFEI